jgi:hypothetical protein
MDSSKLDRKCGFCIIYVSTALASIQESIRTLSLPSGSKSTPESNTTVDSGEETISHLPRTPSSKVPRYSPSKPQWERLESMAPVSERQRWMSTVENGWATEANIFVLKNPSDLVCWIDIIFHKMDGTSSRKGDPSTKRATRYIFGTNTERRIPAMPDCLESYKGPSFEKDAQGSDKLSKRWTCACSEMFFQKDFDMILDPTVEATFNIPCCKSLGISQISTPPSTLSILCSIPLLYTICHYHFCHRLNCSCHLSHDQLRHSYVLSYRGEANVRCTYS